MKQDEVVLRVSGLSKQYIGVQALNNIDFSLKKGEIKCLAGENGSGKSTFTKIIAGAEKPTSGDIEIFGNKYKQLSSSEAMSLGIQVIYQDLSLFEHMTVAENIVINKYINEKKKLVSKKETEGFAQKILDQIGISLPLDVPIRELSIANKQVIAICRCLSLDAKILFMDEPTTTLTKNEIVRLFEIIKGLKEKGMSVVFISHKLDEVIQICDRFAVLRNGNFVGDFPSADITEKKLAFYMTGKDVLYPKFIQVHKNGNNLIELRDLTKETHYKNVNLVVKKGEIVGLIGLTGAGRTELALSLFGLNKPDSGQIFFKDKEVNIKNPSKAVKLGIGLVPEQRAIQGLFLKNRIDENIVSAILDRLKTKVGFYKKKQATVLTLQSISKLSIKTPSHLTNAESLSGGNQQKIVVAKWNLVNPELIILDSPTVGIDIGSKAEVYQIIQDYVKSNDTGAILISDEVGEIVSNCSRVIVMFRGKIICEFDGNELCRSDIEQVITETIENGYILKDVAN